MTALKAIAKLSRTVSVERLPTNTTSKYHPIQRWFNFIAGYSPEFVYQCCMDAMLDKSSVLLDPFAGCATSLVVAKSIGIRSYGYEPHPIFSRIGNAKINSPLTTTHLDSIQSEILKGFKRPVSATVLPPAPYAFLQKLFPRESLEQLLGARAQLFNSLYKDDDLAFLVLSKVLDLSSHSQTDGIYKAPTSRKRELPPKEAVHKVISDINSDLSGSSNIYGDTAATLFQSSSENMAAVLSESVSIIVTSPPYLNNFDFAEMTRMYLYFWGIANSWGEITERVRSSLIVNTTTALKGHKGKQNEYRNTIPSCLHGQLDELVALLEKERCIRAGKKEYDFLVYPYFSQMTAVLRESLRCLIKNGRIHIMVADAALYGVHISTPQLLTEIMNEIGFSRVTCDFVRQRGHRWILSKRDGSKQGLGEYHIIGFK